MLFNKCEIDLSFSEYHITKQTKVTTSKLEKRVIESRATVNEKILLCT